MHKVSGPIEMLAVNKVNGQNITVVENAIGAFNVKFVKTVDACVK